MTWRSSSRSATDGNCVQVRGDLTAIRDSKDTNGPILRLDISNLIATVKAGRRP